MKSVPTRADIVLVAVVSAVCCALLLFFVMPRNEGATVSVTQNGTETARFPLNEDRSVRLEASDGGSNELCIRNGTAQIISADCPGGHCVRTGAVSHVGDTIVCLPHRLVICIEAGS